MPLSNADISRIRGLGFSEDSFVAKKNGERRLRNSKGRCVFHNGHLCTIYGDRPEGCRIYPVVFDVDAQEVVLDRNCSYNELFSITPGLSHDITRLIQILHTEKSSRLKPRQI
jgi:Fe-S-cluster containining protein